MDRSDHASPASAFRVPAFQDELAHLSNFVERALLASKAERGGLAPTPVPTDLSALLDDLSESYRLLAEERELRSDSEIAPPRSSSRPTPTCYGNCSTACGKTPSATPNPGFSAPAG